VCQKQNVWTYILAMAGPAVTLGVGWQLYTAATRGYLMTGHSMNRKVHRDKNPRLFRNNVIANVVVFPILVVGSVLIMADAFRALGR
jgi:hypothetical protein